MNTLHPTMQQALAPFLNLSEIPMDDLDPLTLDSLQIKSERIGTLSNDYGWDEYTRLTSPVDNLTPEQAKAWLLPQVYRDTHTPGGLYCHTVWAVQVQYSDNAVICTIEHRYDV